MRRMEKVDLTRTIAWWVVHKGAERDHATPTSTLRRYPSTLAFNSSLHECPTPIPMTQE